MSRIFVMVQPGARQEADAILAALDRIGTRQKTVYVAEVPSQAVGSPYKDHADKPYFAPMVKDIGGNPAVFAVYDGTFKDFKAAKEVLRKRYSWKVEKHPDYLRSALHCSETDRETRRDLAAWKSYL